MRVGLTGGIGSGKSEVSRLLAEHGAVVIDSDQLARAVMARGTPGLAAVVAEFGPDVLGPDGELDRAALAAQVFADDDARRRLNAIVHPLVGQAAAELTAALPPDAIVVHDVPLLVEAGMAGAFDVVVVVTASPDTRLARLSAHRGMSAEDARARMDAQATAQERERVANVVLRNDGTLAELSEQVDALWAQLVARATAPGKPDAGDEPRQSG